MELPRESVLAPHRHRPLPLNSFVYSFSILVFFLLFYLLSGIWRDAFRLVMVNDGVRSLSLSFPFSTIRFPLSLSWNRLVPLHFSLFSLVHPIANSTTRERVDLVLSQRRAQRCRSAATAAAIDVGCIRNFDTRRLLSLWRARILSPFLRRSHPFASSLSFSLSGGY